jgi:hypothetical protein
MVWCELFIENLTESRTVVESSFVNTYHGRRKYSNGAAQAVLRVPPGTTGRSTLEPELGVMWVECGVGGHYTFGIYSKDGQNLGTFDVKIGVPAVGMHMFEAYMPMLSAAQVEVRKTVLPRGGKHYAVRLKVTVEDAADSLDTVGHLGNLKMEKQGSAEQRRRHNLARKETYATMEIQRRNESKKRQKHFDLAVLTAAMSA